MKPLKPFYANVQTHYDLSNDFYRLFLDPTCTYSCAYFQRDEMSLEEAQRAKIKLSLDKCDLRPGMRLLDVGCGWGTTALQAAADHGVRVVGLTLSENQFRAAQTRAAGRGDVEFRLQGWEEFNEPVDRIVSIGALEHFRVERFMPFFQRCCQILPEDGSMMIHSIVHGTTETLAPGQSAWDEPFLNYAKFVRKHIFPGGQVPPREQVVLHATTQGFEITETQSLRPHYARTLEIWAENLTLHRQQAVRMVGEEVYDRYLRYLTQSAHYFHTGHIDVVQFTMRKR